MWGSNSSFRMRGRNDGSERKHFVLSMCLMLVTVTLICIYYGSFFKSALQRRRESAFLGADEELISRRFMSLADEEDDTEKASLRVEDDGEVLFTESTRGKEKKGELVHTAEESIFDMSIKSFPVCDRRHSELIPCLDRNLNSRLKWKLNQTLMEHYERHCPPPHRRLNCLIPPPPNYKDVHSLGLVTPVVVWDCSGKAAVGDE